MFNIEILALLIYTDVYGCNYMLFSYVMAAQKPRSHIIATLFTLSRASRFLLSTMFSLLGSPQLYSA